MSKASNPAALSFLALMALMPVLAVEMPRALAFGPALIGVAFFVAQAIKNKTMPAIPRASVVMILATIGLAALSIIWSIDPEVSLERTIKLCGVLLPGILLLGAAAALPLDNSKALLWIFPAGLALAAAFIISELVFDMPLYCVMRGIDNPDTISKSVFNRATVTITFCAFPAYGLLRHYTASRKIRAAFILVLSALFLMTHSQSAQLAVVLGIITAFFFPYARKKAWMALFGLIAVLMLSAPYISIWAFNHLASTLDAMPVIGEKQGFAGARLEIWDFISRYTLSNPLWGFGIEATRTIDNFDTAQIYHGDSSILHPHNFALQLWMEFGLIGAVSGALFLGAILHLMQKRLTPAQSRITLPVFIAALSVGATGYGMWQSWWLGLLLMTAAMCTIATRLEKSSR